MKYLEFLSLLLPHMGSEERKSPATNVPSTSHEPFWEIFIKDSKPFIEGDSGEFPLTEFTRGLPTPIPIHKVVNDSLREVNIEFWELGP